jgi:hypothetical protein
MFVPAAPYSDDDRAKMLQQTLDDVAAKRAELEEAWANTTRAW